MTLKYVIAGLVFSGCLMAAGGTSTIPKDATANADGTYSWTDKQGKTWIYLQTPFGLSRTPASAAPAGKKAVPKGVPAGAKLNSDGTWAWTDKAGAKWKYLVTPFGVSRYPVAAGEEGPGAAEPGVKIIDKGDTVRIERQTPFGTSVMEKKKSELTDEERRELERQSASPDANQKANQ